MTNNELIEQPLAQALANPRLDNSLPRSSLAGAPRQFSHLGFVDLGLENEFLSTQFNANRRWIIGGIALSLLMLVALSWLDFFYVPRPAIPNFEFVRYGIMTPTLALGLIGFFFFKRPRGAIVWIATVAAVLGVSLAALLFVGGEPAIDYVDSISIQAVLLTCFLVGLPFRWAAFAALLTITCNIGTVAYLRPAYAHLWYSVLSLGIVGFLALFVLFRFESGARQTFVARRQVESEYAQRLAAERDRNHWLEIIAGFLRHELKNSMTGISSSLELMGRTSLDREAAIYLDRAKSGVQFMRRFLQQAAYATSLEAALLQQEAERLNLSDLVAGRARDYGEDFPYKTFNADIDFGIFVVGNSDSIVQMLDKLINNAVEHSHSNEPIEISLKVAGQQAVLTVLNVGDPLPADHEGIFEPFVGQKIRRNETNLGLGLFVARVIVVHHSGRIRAESLAEIDGARLIVELPRSLDA
jgi:signal transduction histidine kinase